jgi:hypothetical protein
MRTLASLLLVAVLAAPAASAPAAGFAGVETPRVPVCGQDGTAPLLAAGGTPVSNGIFFPGTAVRDGNQVRGEPYKIQKGCNIRFFNLDHVAVANAHRIVSFDRRRNGRPLFFSRLVRGPGEVVMRTEHLRPGVYPYFCSIHAGQLGILEVANGMR